MHASGYQKLFYFSFLIATFSQDSYAAAAVCPDVDTKVLLAQSQKGDIGAVVLDEVQSRLPLVLQGLTFSYVWGDYLPLRSLGNQSARIVGMGFSANGSKFVYASADGVYLVSTTGNTGPELLHTYEKNRIAALEVDAHGKRLAVALAKGTIHLYDGSFRKDIGELPNADSIASLAFSPNGLRLAATSPHSGITIWGFGQKKSGKLQVVRSQDVEPSTLGDIHSPRSVCFSSVAFLDNNAIAYASRGGSLRSRIIIRDYETGDNLIDMSGRSVAVGKKGICAITPETLSGPAITIKRLTETNGLVNVRDIERNAFASKFVHAVALSGDNSVLAGYAPTARLVALFDAQRGHALSMINDLYEDRTQLGRFKVPVPPIKFSPKTNVLACQGKDGSIMLWAPVQTVLQARAGVVA